MFLGFFHLTMGGLIRGMSIKTQKVTLSTVL